MKKFRSFVALCLAMVMAFSFSAVAFAAEPEVDAFADVVLAEDETVVYQDDEVMIVETSATDSGISPYSTDYNSVWVANSGSGNFTVHTSNSGTVGVILSVSSSDSSSSAYISVKKPNGSFFKNDVYLTPSTNGGEATYKMYFASSGTYTIYYTAYTSVGMRIMCTLYK